MINEIQKGTIKVVWVEDESIIRSKMFTSIEDARQFASNMKDYLIFELLEEKNMEEFRWKMLEYGRYGIYKKLYALYKKNILLSLLNNM